MLIRRLPQATTEVQTEIRIISSKESLRKLETSLSRFEEEEVQDSKGGRQRPRLAKNAKQGPRVHTIRRPCEAAWPPGVGARRLVAVPATACSHLKRWPGHHGSGAHRKDTAHGSGIHAARTRPRGRKPRARAGAGPGGDGPPAAEGGASSSRVSSLQVCGRGKGTDTPILPLQPDCSLLKLEGGPWTPVAAPPQCSCFRESKEGLPPSCKTPLPGHSDWRGHLTHAGPITGLHSSVHSDWSSN